MIRNILMFILGSLLLACSAEPLDDLKFKGVNMSREQIGGDFKLMDHNGREISLKTFENQVLIVSFGYLHCPDFCPITLSEHVELVQNLGDLAQSVKILFVSIDPERDTPERLKAYVTAFHPDFLAATGSEQAINAVRKQYKIVAEKQGDSKDSYTIDHSTGSYVFDKKGNLRVYFPFGLSLDAQLQDVRALLGTS